MESSWYRIEVSSSEGWKQFGTWGKAYSHIKSYDSAVDTIQYLRSLYQTAKFRLVHVWTDEAVIQDV